MKRTYPIIALVLWMGLFLGALSLSAQKTSSHKPEFVKARNSVNEVSSSKKKSLPEIKESGLFSNEKLKASKPDLRPAYSLDKSAATNQTKKSKKPIISSQRSQSTSCEQATEAMLGENSTPSAPYWFYYTMPSTGFVKISSVGFTTEDTYLAIFNDCQSEPVIESDDFEGTQSQVTLYGEQGTSFYIYWVDAYTTAAFTWSLEEVEAQPGDFCINAIETQLGVNTMNQLVSTDHWFVFTMPEEGRLNVSTEYTSAYFYAWRGDCDNGYYDGGGYGNFNIKDLSVGETIYFNVLNQGSEVFNFTLDITPFELGDNCNLPIMIEQEANVITVNNGSTWFSYTIPQLGKLVIEPQNNIGYNIYTGDCSFLESRGGGYTVNTFTNFEQGENIYIEFENYEAETDLSWNIYMLDFVDGDICELPIPAFLGDNNVEAAGTYWYSFTMPEEGKLVLSSSGGESYAQLVTFDCEDYKDYHNGFGGLTAAGIAPGTPVYIQWQFYGEGTFLWNLAIEDYQAGDLCSLAVPAIQGNNTLPVGHGSYWYSFTMPQDGKLAIRSEMDSYIELRRGACENTNYIGEGYGSVFNSELREGMEFFIVFNRNYDVPQSWNLAIEDLLPGDNCSLAVAAQEGDNNIPNQEGGSYWFSYTPDREGRLLASINTDDNIAIYTGGCQFNNEVVWSYGSAIYKGLVVGEELLIRIETSSEISTMSLSIEDYVDGDICILASEAVVGENEIPYGSQGEYWYAFTMPSEGKLRLSSVNQQYFYVDYFVGADCESLIERESVSNQYSSLLTEVSQGETVYIRFDYYDTNDQGGQFGYLWNLSIEPLQGGDVCALAIDATATGNILHSTINGGYERWFKYTMPSTGRLVLSSEAQGVDAEVKFYKGSCGNLEAAKGYYYENPIYTEGVEGDIIYIRAFVWEILQDITFNVSIDVLQNGDNCGLAVEVFEGVNEVPITGSTYWTVFNVLAEGELTILPDWSTNNDLYFEVYSDCNTLLYGFEELEDIIGDQFSDGITLTNLSAGETIYIHWYVDSEVESGSFSLNFDSNKLDQTITFNTIETKTYGDAAFTLSATSSADLMPFTFHVINGPATITGNQLMITGAGIVSVLAQQAGNEEYDPAQATQQFMVNKKGLSVTADSKSIIYGEALPSLTVSYQDFVNGDEAADLAQQPIASTSATVNSDAGTYDIVVGGGIDANYDFEYISGTLTINKADQSISITPITDKIYSDGSVTIEATTTSALALAYAITGPGTLSGNVITFTGGGIIEVTVSQAGNINYNSAQSSISFNVTDDRKTSQTITFPSISNKTYGDVAFNLGATASSGLTVSYSVVSGPATVNGSSVTITGAGNVTIEANQAGDDSFNPAPAVQQSFTVIQKALSVTADNKTITYGEAIPELTITYNGFVTGEGASNLDVAPSISTTANVNSDAGTYAINVLGGIDDNYQLVLINGSLTINKANQTITIDAIEDVDFNNEETSNTIEVIASTTSGLELAYQVSGPASITGTTITLTEESGTVTVTVSQAGNVNYNAAESTENFNVTELDFFLGTKPLIDAELSVYPNPSAGSVTLNVNRLPMANYEIKIMSLLGETVWSKSINNGSQINEPINLGGFQKGLYLLQVSSENMLRTEKLILE